MTWHSHMAGNTYVITFKSILSIPKNYISTYGILLLRYDMYFVVYHCPRFHLHSLYTYVPSSYWYPTFFHDQTIQTFLFLSWSLHVKLLNPPNWYTCSWWHNFWYRILFIPIDQVVVPGIGKNVISGQRKQINIQIFLYTTTNGLLDVEHSIVFMTLILAVQHVTTCSCNTY